MLSLFPTMFLSLLAHAILRIFVGAIFFYLGLRHLGRSRSGLTVVLKEHWPVLGGFYVWYLGLIEVVIGIMFIVGIYTQAAAIVSMLISIKMLLLRRRFAHPSIPQPIFYTLLFAASLSRLITGAGAFAIDLPI